MNVVVCGAGVIGASVAYYLTRHGLGPTLLERTAVACAASGKSGGFLARDWCDGSALGPLARASFALHRELAASFAENLAVDTGYRAVETLLVADGPRAGGNGGAGGWLDGRATVRGWLGTRESTAQVHPARLTGALVDAACAAGARLEIGELTGVTIDGGRIRGVLVDGRPRPADAVVFALGPWTRRLASWMPVPPIVGLRGNSVVLRPAAEVPAQALFVETADPAAGNISPEVYPRPDGEVYVCGMADDLPFPDDPAAVAPSEEACALLARVAGNLSSVLADAPVVRRQACFRPLAPDGLPLLGPVEGVAGAYLATGHNCWGILNAPASGAALAELIATGESTLVDLSPYDPARFSRRLAGRGAGPYHRP